MAASLRINDIGCVWLGYSKEEMLQKRLEDIDSEKFAGKIEDRMNEVMEKGFGLFPTEWRSKNGNMIPVEIRCQKDQL